MVNLNIDGNLSAKKFTGELEGDAGTVNGHTVKSDVPENAVFTDTVYDDTEIQKRISDNGYGEVAGGKNLVTVISSFSTPNNEIIFAKKDDSTLIANGSNYNTGVSLSDDFLAKAGIIYTAQIITDLQIDIFVWNIDEHKGLIPIKNDNKTFSFSVTKDTNISIAINANNEVFNNAEIKIQLEEGSVATEYEPYFPSNKMLAEEKADKKETTVNLIEPLIESKVQTGITFTQKNNKIHVEGTSTDNTFFNEVGRVYLEKGKTYKFLPADIGNGNVYIYLTEPIYQGTTFTWKLDSQYVYIVVNVWNRQTVSNDAVLMITTNLNATINDFVPYTGNTGSLNGDVANIMKNTSTANFHNIPRNIPKDITSYITNGTFYKRLNGIDGFKLFEDIYVGDYIKMSRAITCPDSTDGVVGSQYVTIAGLDTMMYNGEDDNYVNYHHAVMVPGQGFEGIQHFGRHAMNATNTTDGGYVASVMNQSVLGAVATEGYTASGATINQQLYAEFGSHLKTTDELLSTSINATGTNRFGTANGCSNNWGWAMRQAVLMSEVEVYGSTVWSSSGYDTGNAKMQLPLFAYSREAMNNRSSYYFLKDVASASFFCYCNVNGNADCSNAGSTWYYVRPRFILS